MVCLKTMMMMVFDFCGQESKKAKLPCKIARRGIRSLCLLSITVTLANLIMGICKLIDVKGGGWRFPLSEPYGAEFAVS